jgi:hypothetical protein
LARVRMIPTYYSPVYPTFHDVACHLRQALGGKDARDLACLNFSGDRVVNPKRLVVQSAHEQPDPFSGAVYVVRNAINHAICDEDLEHSPSRASGYPLDSLIRLRSQMPKIRLRRKRIFTISLFIQHGISSGALCGRS